VSDAAQIALLRKRLMRMIAIVAVVGVIGYLSYHIAWMGGLFAVATLAGFGAQIWLIVSFARARRPH